MLLRYPGLFVALAVGAMLLVLAAAAYPLFVSASAGELLAERIDDPLVTRFGAGARYRNGTMPLEGASDPGSPVTKIDRAFRKLVDPVPHVGPIFASTLGPPVSVSTPEGNQTREVRPLVGDEAVGHVQKIVGDGDSGVWMPQLAAEALGVGPGDEIVVSEGPRDMTLTVDGVYRDIFREPGDGYWRPWNDEIVLYCEDCPPPPQPLIVDPPVFDELVSTLQLRRGGVAWQAAVDQDLTFDDAVEVDRGLDIVADTVTDVSTREGRLLQRCYTGFCGRVNGPSFTSSMGDVLTQVQRRLAAVESPAELLRVAGLLVALVVVAAAGAFAMSARRVEASLLFARGTGPRTVGARAGLEALLPCVVGAGVGLALAVTLVSAVGPNGPVAASARSTALRAALVGATVAVVTIAIVSAVSFLRHSEHHRARLRFLTKVPWEIALIAGALLVLARLRTDGALVTDAASSVSRPSPLVLLFPVLFLAGFAVLAARLAVAALRAGRRWSAGLPPATFLAVRRLVDAPQLTMLLVGASALCLGLFVQAQAMADSMRTTMDAKAGVYVGADVQARTDYGYEPPPPEFGAPYTRVTRQYQSGTFDTGVPFDLLAVDAATVTDVAYWDDGFADESFEALVGGLVPEDRTGPLPVIVARSRGAEPTGIELASSTLPVEVIGEARAFPGMSSIRPLVVVDAQRLLEAVGDDVNPLDVPGASTELWIRGSVSEAMVALSTLPYVPSIVLTTEEVKDIPHIAAVIDAFLVMNVLGLAAAFLVLAAIVMYLQARQRSQVVSYGLSLRMGMDGKGHRRAVAAELVAMLAVAGLVGVGLAIVAARLVVPLLDPLAAVPPDPIPVIPLVSVLVLPVVLAFVVILGARLTERRARAVDLGQVMRLAD
jgi:putative ABC transport system permease protein